jgi:hypothetical protein
MRFGFRGRWSHMLVLPAFWSRSAIAKAGLGSFSSFDHFVLGNLAATFRQSATVLAFVGCATACHTTVTQAPIATAPSASNQSAQSKPAEPKPPEAVREVAQTPMATESSTTLPLPLPLQGFEPAVIRLPTEGRPLSLFVVTHGAGGQAEWHCRHYESMLGPSAGLLCLSGKRVAARDPTRGYYYPNHIELASELLSARTTMLETYGAALRGKSAVYVGYSQGASMGALAVAEHGDFWPLLVLVEGGFDSWSPAMARKFENGGGQRVVFVCGTEHCHRHALKAASTLVAVGLEAKLLYAPGAGHRPDGPVAARVREALEWLLEGDRRYSGVLEHLKQLQ